MTQSPGSKWIPVASPGIVTSLIVCRYGMPFRKASAWLKLPRFGTDPRLFENDNVSSVRFSSRTLSPPAGAGKSVGVAALSGRNIVLKPLPMNVPLKAASGPRAGSGGTGALGTVRLETGPNLNLVGNERTRSNFSGVIWRRLVFKVCSPDVASAHGSRPAGQFARLYKRI